MDQIEDRIYNVEHENLENMERLDELLNWLQSAKAILEERNNRPLPLSELERLIQLKVEHERYKGIDFKLRRRCFKIRSVCGRENGKRGRG